jgi:hypothetical protein
MSRENQPAARAATEDQLTLDVLWRGDEKGEEPDHENAPLILSVVVA